ncbi:MAG: hypothetical protein PHH30_11925 [Bacteroidales bacterium]|jgi:hypothetical protein|nr:hypothetical protein [Bacteroidales bacterium]
MLSTDKAFDILPHIVDVYEKLELDKYIKDKQKKYKKNPVSQTQAGIDLFKYIFRNTSKIKSEIITIVAILQGKTEEEIAKQDFMQTIDEVKNLFMDKETMSFFKQAVQ